VGSSDSRPLTISATISLKQTGSVDKGEITLEAGLPVTFEYRFACNHGNPAGYLRAVKITDEKSGVFVTGRFGSGSNRLTSVSTLHRTTKGPFKYRQFSWFEVIGQEVAAHTRLKSYPFAPGEKAGWKRIEKIIEDFGLFILVGYVQRVSSGRSAPKRWYPTTEGTGSRSMLHMWELFDDVSPAHIRATQGGPVDFSRLAARSADIKDVNSELKKLGIASKITAEKLSAYHSTLEVTDSKTRIKSKLIEVGYGASQVLPVILACHSPNGSPLFIEQPEIHLHPKAQGVIADLVCQTSKRRQVIVETHSEHMINRARLLIAQGNLNPNDVVINYVDRGKNGSSVFPIRIGRNGQFLDEWPEGFFDERFQDTMALARMNAK